MKILWASNYSTQSGYSTQARLFVPRLQQMGHEMVVLELGATGMPRMIGGIQVLPTALDPLGNDIIRAHCDHLKIDALVTLCDAWGFRPEAMSGLPWFPLAPVDHMPVPPNVVHSLRASRRPIALSRFGVEQLRKAGFNPAYLPHGLDPTVWKPLRMADARRLVNIAPEVFWVSFVGVNDSVGPNRKGIPELLMAWSVFSQRHADARLYLHTSKEGNLPVNGMGGVRIDELMKVFEIDERTVTLVDQYAYRTGIPQAHLAQIGSASDVFILPTLGEGFGIPLIEMQRVGCPVITTNFATGAELCASGWLLEGEPLWTVQNATVLKPSVISIVERLEQAYEARGDMRYRIEAIEFARDYDIDTVIARYGAPLLEGMADNVLMAA